VKPWVNIMSTVSCLYSCSHKFRALSWARTRHVDDDEFLTIACGLEINCLKFLMRKISFVRTLW
jgi:hypothetical protein